MSTDNTFLLKEFHKFLVCKKAEVGKEMMMEIETVKENVIVRMNTKTVHSSDT